MDWRLIIRAVAGEPTALALLEWGKWSHDVAMCAALLLLEDALPSAALVVAGCAAWSRHGPPVAAALAPHTVSALAAWRADPTWADRCIGVRKPDNLIRSIVSLIAALQDNPVALRNAVGIIARDGWWLIDECFEALGAAGWRALDDATRLALRMCADRVSPDAIGWVWSSLTAAQQAETAGAAATNAHRSAALISRIGAAWQTTDAALRDRLIDAAAREPWCIHRCAPVWTVMTHAESARLVTAVVAQRRGRVASDLLNALGRDGRRALSSSQRGALDAIATQVDAWGTALLRVGDAGWGGASNDERRMLMTRAATDSSIAAALIRAVGIDGWRATPTDVQATLRASVQRNATMLLACPPALWHDLADGRPLPPVSITDPWVISQWRAEDADTDLSFLPREHQALVLALAPWLPDDLAPQSPRMARLLGAWNGMTADERVALATDLPQALAVVAAAARLTASSQEPNQSTAAVADAITVMAQRDAPAAAARATVGRMLAAQRRWRPWMRAFAPTTGDPPEAWEAWRAGALLGAIPDRAVVLRLMAHGAPREIRRARLCARAAERKEDQVWIGSPSSTPSTATRRR